MSDVILPRLPIEFHSRSTLKIIRFLIFALSMLIVPGFISYFAYNLSLALYFKIPIIIVCSFLVAKGFHLCGWVGHDGFHGGLLKNRYLSTLLGITFASLIVLNAFTGFMVTHWNHHRYCNTVKDHDSFIFSRFKSYTSRLLFGTLCAAYFYTKYTVMMILRMDLPFDFKSPYRKTDLQVFASYNMFLSILFITAFVLITLHNPTYGVLAIWIPAVLFFGVSGLRPFAEHAGTYSDVAHNARARINTLYTFMHHYNNYHNVHHLYPSIPCYNLPKVHEFLINSGFYKQDLTHIDSSIWAGVKYSFAKYHYPAFKDQEY